MIRAQQRAAARASGGGAQARTIDIPLPTKGILVEAQTAEISGIFAGELINWQSTGASLELRSQHSVALDGDIALQRIPFEYGAHQKFIKATRIKVETDTGFVYRLYRPTIDVAYISSHAIMVDGYEAPLTFNGATLAPTAFTTETDLTQNDFDGIIAHQDRVFLWKTGDEIDFYYGDVGAITGPVARFPLGRLGNITGSILAVQSLTVDAGHGMNDTLAIFTTTGKIVAYEGLNPGDAQDWRLLTRISAAPPISKEAFLQVGSDMWMLTASGVVSVGQTIRDSSLALVNTVSQPIQKTLVAQIAEGGDWSMHLSADATRVIINRVFNGAASQFIYRTDTKSWLVTDYPAKAWHNIGRQTQFTTLDGELATLDGGTAGPITAKWVSSWFRLPRSAGITYLQPTIIANGPLTVKVTILSDHDATGVDITEAEQTVTIQPDNPADPNGRISLNDIIAVDAVGEVFQIRMEVTATWAELVHLKAAVI